MVSRRSCQILEKRASFLAVVFVTALFMTFTVISASEPIVVELWMNEGNNLRASIQPIVERFNAESTQIKINLADFAGNVTEDRVITAVAAGVTPDIVQGSYLWAPGWAEQGIIAPLDEFVERDSYDLSDFFPLALEAGNTYRGELIGLPLFLQLTVLYYNEQALAESGTVPPSDHWTWRQLEEALLKNRRLGPQGEIEHHAMTAYVPQHPSNMFIEQVGARFWDPETALPDIDVDKFARAFGFYESLVERQLLQARGVHYDDSPGWGRFIQGQSSFHIDGSFRVDVLDRSVDFSRVAPALRADKNLPPATWLGQRTFNIMRTTPEREQAAWEVLKYLTAPESLATFSALSGQVTASRSAMLDPALSERMTQDNFRVMVQQVAPHGSGISGIPDIGRINSEVINPLTAQFVGGDIGLSAFIESLESGIGSILSP